MVSEFFCVLTIFVIDLNPTISETGEIFKPISS